MKITRRKQRSAPAGKTRRTIYLPPELHDWLLAEAAVSNRSVSNYVADLLIRERAKREG